MRMSMLGGAVVVVILVTTMGAAEPAVNSGESVLQERFDRDPQDFGAADSVTAGESMITAQTRYVLVDTSMAVWGCWHPCMCPIQLIGNMYGDFQLEKISETAEQIDFEVSNISWDVHDFATGDYLYTVTGSGTYQVFTPTDGEPTQQLILDLEYDGYADQFDSGEVPLDGDYFGLTIANNDFHCLNDAFFVAAVAERRAGGRAVDGLLSTQQSVEPSRHED